METSSPRSTRATSAERWFLASASGTETAGMSGEPAGLSGEPAGWELLNVLILARFKLANLLTP
jgi:hypothetical protein